MEYKYAAKTYGTVTTGEGGNMEKKKKINTSIFQGWIEWDEYRAEDRGAGVWGIFRKRGDAYVFEQVVRLPGGKATADRLQQAIDSAN